MKTYARIQDGRVTELLSTPGDITGMFNPALVWIDVSSHPAVAEGWQFDGTEFTPPPAPPPTTPLSAIAELQAQFAALGARLAALSSKS